MIMLMNASTLSYAVPLATLAHKYEEKRRTSASAFTGPSEANYQWNNACLNTIQVHMWILSNVNSHKCESRSEYSLSTVHTQLQIAGWLTSSIHKWRSTGLSVRKLEHSLAAFQFLSKPSSVFFPSSTFNLITGLQSRSEFASGCVRLAAYPLSLEGMQNVWMNISSGKRLTGTVDEQQQNLAYSYWVTWRRSIVGQHKLKVRTKFFCTQTSGFCNRIPIASVIDSIRIFTDPDQVWGTR